MFHILLHTIRFLGSATAEMGKAAEPCQGCRAQKSMPSLRKWKKVGSTFRVQRGKKKSVVLYYVIFSNLKETERDTLSSMFCFRPDDRHQSVHLQDTFRSMRAYKSRHVLPLADLATILVGVNLYAAKFMFRLMCFVSVPKKATFSCSGECRANIPPSYHGRILEQEKINWYILGVSESLSL